MSFQLNPPDSLKETRKSVLRHGQKVFAELAKKLWDEPFFHAMRQTADENVLDLLPRYSSPDEHAVGLFDVLVVALKVPGDVGIATGKGGLGLFKASPEFEPVANLLGAGLRPGIINLCKLLRIEPSPVHMIWCSICVLWPAESAEEQISSLLDVAGIGLFSIETATMAFRPEPELPKDVLRREGIDFFTELENKVQEPARLPVDWTRPGAKKGSGTFADREAFKAVFGPAVQELRGKHKNPTTGNVIKHLRTRFGKVDRAQLTRWHQAFGWATWADFLADVN